MADELPYSKGTIKLTWIDPKNYEILNSAMFETIEGAISKAPKDNENWMLFRLESTDGINYTWKLLPYGQYKEYINGILGKEIEYFPHDSIILADLNIKPKIFEDVELKYTLEKGDSIIIRIDEKKGRKFRKIDFLRNTDSTGIVTSLEYDPHRTAFIASVYDFLNRRYFFMLAPKNLNIGDVVKSGFSAEVKIGHSLTLLKIPIGGFIHNISLRENRKAQFTRSAGTTAQLIEKTSKYCRVVLSSGIHKFIQPTCYATIGTVSN